MLKKLMRKIGYIKVKNKINHENQSENEERTPSDNNSESKENGNVSVKLSENIRKFKETLGDCGDLKIHEFKLGGEKGFRAAVFFIDGMANGDTITEAILKPILMHTSSASANSNVHNPQQIKELVLCSGEITESSDFDELVLGCLNGDTAIIFEGFKNCLLVSTKGWEKRSVSEPATESVVRGPREGFTENFRTNTSLLRRKIKSPKLRMDHMIIGNKSATSVCIAYIDGVAKPEVINLVKERLAAIKTDAVLDSGYLEEFIEDAPFSIFPTVGYTEKPDVAAAKILEGRIAIIVDGSPFALTAPLLFIESFQTSEDYSARYIYASITRMLRFFAFIIAVFGPSIYIALTTFHQELIPTTLLFTIAQAREGTPFPAVIEAFVMVIAFEILREAGIRLPRPVGQAISIVGALIMGDAAVSAGLVGAPMVITIAITSVSSFVVPEQADAIIIVRFVSMVLSAILGGFGIAICFIAVLIHLASMSSFGVSYFDGFTATRNMEDTLIRMPLWTMKKRPLGLVYKDQTRLIPFVPPKAEPVNDSKKSNKK